ncbi:hypothetical protein RUMCAL_00936 [Ruminococcus callidus ATCC 27760]|uniref:Uncharacterized protein n=2 Tax=Ruminococcus callidus ATCC 27760 TaxID=411473 RepID=U2MBK8_9FIRM|nr:hypothetical protein RUMCAL_00936 [Ruminococcus callidus ATCC 27760]
MCVRCVVRFFGRLSEIPQADCRYYGKGFLGNMTGKSVRRLRAKPSGGLYAVFPLYSFLFQPP